MRRANTVLACLLLAGMAYAQVSEAWVKRYNNALINGGDESQGVATDASGNVYVTGYSRNSTTILDDDYATIKYNPAGAEQWVRRYSQPGNWDYAYAIALDADGNVYMTGKSAGSGTNYDYATIKYDPAGNEKWVQRYNGLASGHDIASALAVDGSGNVYVTGTSAKNASPPVNFDYVTIKYNPAGAEQWVRRYDGPGTGDDQANAIAVDADGNVHVFGYGPGDVGGGVYDYATVKYDTDGNLKWARGYNCPGNSGDYAQAIALDADGNVYVTGYGPMGTNTDYATVKYDKDGNEKWARGYNGLGNGTDCAYAVAVDGSGNVYVTGKSQGDGTNSDYATVKYDTDGNEKWVRRYNGPDNALDQATAIAVDANCNVYVTGYSNTPSSGDYATVKYNSAGDKQWVMRYDGPGNGDDQVKAIAVDGSRNVYVTGYSTGTGTGKDYATIKYTQAPEPFALSSPTNHALAEPIEGDLTWEAASGADYYTVFLGTDPSPDSLTDVTGTSCHYGPLLNDQKYYWTTHAKNAVGRVQTSSGIWDFTTIVAAPAAPVLVSPPDGATNQLTSGTLIWNISARATGYDVYLDVEDPPLELVSENQPERGYEYSGLADDQTCYWKVVARNVGGEAESETWDFTTIVAAPEPFTLALPENNAVNVPLTGDLEWSASTRADWYDVYLDENPDPATKVGTVNAPATTLPYTGHVTNGKTYYWKVVAGNVGGTTASSVWSFSTVPWREGWTEAKPIPGAPSAKPVKDGAWLAIDGSQRVFAAKGYKTGDFYSYDAVLDTWQARESIPADEAGRNKPPSKGCVGVSDGENYVYITKGNNTLGFRRYNVDADTWELLPEVPLGEQNKKVKGGTDMVYAVYKDTGCVFLLKGYKTEFYRYNTEAERWDALPNAPAGGGKSKYDKGSFLVYDGANTIYAHQAKYNDGANHYMFKFDIPTQAWTDTLKGMPLPGWHGGKPGKNKKSKDGGAGAWYGDSIYALKGGNTGQFYQYTPGGDTWHETDTLPAYGSTERKKYVKAGGDLVSYGYGVFFALKGNKTLELWRYVTPADGLPLTANGRSGVMAENVEVRTPKFELLPNPIASGFALLRIQGIKDSRNQGANVRVFDASGRCVLVRSFDIRHSEFALSLDLRKVPAGVYLVRLDAEGFTATEKLVVQR